ncbi:MAG: hypothetical protein CM1200mP41_34930 [Gammaproteobacteria bacterium]|nr:MAG: hypothetical protein CM1200mP41_34930 [Gammaproteobacteria bacterium]
MAGEIRGQWYHAGRFFNAALDKASEKTNATHCGSKHRLARISLLYRLLASSLGVFHVTSNTESGELPANGMDSLNLAHEWTSTCR